MIVVMWIVRFMLKKMKIMRMDYVENMRRMIMRMAVKI